MVLAGTVMLVSVYVAPVPTLKGTAVTVGVRAPATSVSGVVASTNVGLELVATKKL